MTRLAVLVLAAALAPWGVPTPAWACLWDRDTLATEVRGLPDVVDVLTGKFERNPPAFYEVRLSRVTAEVEANPGELGLYDDAGVAADRLGRGTEALEWMARKEAAMQGLSAEEGAEPRYRLLANRGTFKVHAWIRAGANRGEPALLEEALADLEAAVALNPDAHFGRERVQVRAVRWLKEAPEWAGPTQYGLSPLDNFLGMEPDVFTLESELAERDLDGVVEGLTGLIVLGAAWESVDVLNALALALRADGRNAVAFLAELRLQELIGQGHRSLQPGAPEGEVLLRVVDRHSVVLERRQEGLREDFARRRAEAAALQTARWGYLSAQLQAGWHPDTDPQFWAEAPRDVRR